MLRCVCNHGGQLVTRSGQFVQAPVSLDAIVKHLGSLFSCRWLLDVLLLLPLLLSTRRGSRGAMSALVA